MSIESSTEIKALTFDVFGTVVDWRSSIIGELSRFGAVSYTHLTLPTIFSV